MKTPTPSISIFVLRGGILPTGSDGPVSSRGMDLLADRLQGNRRSIYRYNWGKWFQARADILGRVGKSKIVVIGYSGGGSRATWIAEAAPHPAIDLMVLYDPSPRWQMDPISGNVLRAVCYYNRLPLMFGLGGGRLIGTAPIETITVAEQHLAVQFDERLHQYTINEVERLEA
jgi:pimeloyl-ACP methyl ester carboxylesterase